MFDNFDIPMQELDSTTDHRTFGDVETEEQAQWQWVFDRLKDHKFDIRTQARFFAIRCVNHALRRCGVDFAAWRHAAKSCPPEEALYRLWRVRVAKHTRSQEDELWQAGTYIYKRDELVAFISSPALYEGEVVLTVPFWLVRTNVDLPGAKGTIL